MRMFPTWTLMGVLLSFAGCLPDLEAVADLTPPRVVRLSLGALDVAGPPDATPWHAIEIELSEPLDPFTVHDDTVVVAPSLSEGDCADHGFCSRGLCLAEVCQRSAVDLAYRRDVDGPPLSISRRASAHRVRVVLVGDGRTIRIEPLEPYTTAQLYTVVLSAALRDQAGNPLALVDGRERGFVYDFIVRPRYPPSPQATLVWPPDGAEGVPTNLGEIRVGFSSPVFVAGPLALALSSGGVSVDAETFGAPGECGEELAACFIVRPAAALQPLAAYRVSWGVDLVDAVGDPVRAADPPLGFRTGAQADTSPPQLSGLTIGFDGGCYDVGFRTDEPALAQASVRVDGAPVELSAWSAPRVRHRFALGVPLGPAELVIELIDTYENRWIQSPEALPPGRSPVVITEVLANPAGPEPAQEFVEILNLGPDPVSLAGWTVTDATSKAGDQLPAVDLAAQARGVIVPSGYDEALGLDPAPGYEAVMLRLPGSTIGSGGLTNAGEPVYLLDAAGAVVSYFSGAMPGGVVAQNGQSVARDPGRTCAERGGWYLDPSASSTPGW